MSSVTVTNFLSQESNFFEIQAAFKLLLLKTQHTKALFAEILCMHIHVFWYRLSSAGPIFRALFRFVENKIK